MNSVFGKEVKYQQLQVQYQHIDTKNIITKDAKKQIIKVTAPHTWDPKSTLVSSFRPVKTNCPIPEVVPSIQGSTAMGSLLNSKFYP